MYESQCILIPHARTQAALRCTPVVIEACLMFYCLNPRTNVCNGRFDSPVDPSPLVISHSDRTGDLYERRYLGVNMDPWG
jgi:hypothetical protein